MSKSHLGSIRDKISRKVHEFRRLVQTVLVFLSLFESLLGVEFAEIW